MKPLLLFPLMVAALTACDSDAGNPQTLQLVQYGTFKKLATGDDIQAPGSITGARHSVAKVALLEQTTNVVAHIGTSFGLLVKLPGRTGIVQCRAKCIHPKLTDPSTGRSSEVDEWDSPGVAGQEGYVGYTLDNDWELVPGKWTIQVFMDSKLALEKTFNVVPSRK